jgi:hypothetical protein
VQRDRAHVRKRGAHARLEVRREVDLRDEDQHLPARRDRARGGVEVHLGLAAAGHAVQQERRVTAARCDDRGERCLLGGVAGVLWRRRRRLGVVRRRLAPGACTHAQRR